MAVGNADVLRTDPEGWRVTDRMAQVVVSDGVAYLSGVVPTDPSGELIGPGDAEAQARASLDNIEAVLAAAGTTLDNILRATCYATTQEAALAYMAERTRRMKNRPAATTILVSGTLVPGAMMEIEVIARVPR